MFSNGSNNPEGKIRFMWAFFLSLFFLSPLSASLLCTILSLQKGKMDEINHHFSSLHGYKPPQYHEETWYQVSIDEGLSLSQTSPPSNPKEERHGNSSPCTQSPTYPEVMQRLLHTTNSPTPYCQGPVLYEEGPAYYGEEALEVALPPESQSWAWPASRNTQLELVSFPGMEYSMILNPAPLTTAPLPNSHDFYTCVNGVTPSGAVHLVPCVSNPLKGSPCPQLREDVEEDPEKSSQLVVYLEKQAEASASSNGVSPGETEQSAMPLLHHLTNRN